MAAVVLGARVLLLRLGIHAPVVHLAVEVIAGGLVYVGAALVLARQPSRELLNLIRSRKNKARPTETPSPTDAPAPPTAADDVAAGQGSR